MSINIEGREHRETREIRIAVYSDDSRDELNMTPAEAVRFSSDLLAVAIRALDRQAAILDGREVSAPIDGDEA